jgi:hypothetical protein
MAGCAIFRMPLGIHVEGAPMPFQNRMMTLIAFLQAQNCSNLAGSWRHPSTVQDFLTPEYCFSPIEKS